MPNARRTTNANGYARDLLKLPQSTARNLSCQAGAVIPNSPPKHFTLSVRPDGREVFLPPLDPGRVYQVTVHGTCVYWEHWFIFVRPKTHDALYEADDVGNFVNEHKWLSFDGRPLRDSWEFRASLQEDRAAHKYTFPLCGTPERISAKLNIPGQSHRQHRGSARGRDSFAVPRSQGPRRLSERERGFADQRHLARFAGRGRTAVRFGRLLPGPDSRGLRHDLSSRANAVAGGGQSRGLRHGQRPGDVAPSGSRVTGTLERPGRADKRDASGAGGRRLWPLTTPLAR